jgi:hypothetical protein
MPGMRALLPVAVLVHGLFGIPLASADARSFTIHFAGCTEFVGWGPVSLAAAQPLVPAGYVIAGGGASSTTGEWVSPLITEAT